MQPVFDARPILGERFSLPRAGKEPVDLILHRAKKADAPLFLCMHGGGFTSLDAVFVESFCQLLCEKLGYFVINVNYKKSPGVPFPYAIEEIVDSAKYFIAHAGEYGIDAARVGLGGFSAGGSLAAGAALMAMEEGIKLSCQLLVYPVTDLSVPPDADEARKLHRRLYCQNDDNLHRWASPLLAKDEELMGVCPCIMVTCGPDTLRPQGEAYASRLIGLGVPVSSIRYEKALHGFIEVNRPDFFFDSSNDDRVTPEQAAYTRDAEEYLLKQLPVYL
jgi:acetyl esterase